MISKDFGSNKSGALIQSPLGFLAFVPNPLPPEIIFDMELAMALSKADAALSELSGLGGQLPNPHLLISPYMKREAVLSSRIEGTKASLSDLLIDELDEDALKRTRSDDIREVHNYIHAMEAGIKLLERLPISLRLVRAIHEELMRGVRGEKATPGRFRYSQNWIGPQGCTPATAAFVPPPVIEMNDALYAWENFLHIRGTIPDLIQCALMHVQFETIHPFLDGNGRVGRLLITFFLLERKRLSQPLLYLSAYIDTYKADYYELLQRVRTHGEWIPWLRFFLNGITEVATSAGLQAKELHRLREEYRAMLRDKPNALILLDQLFFNPYMTIARAGKVLKKSHPTAKAAISVLEQRKVLKEVTGRQWGKFYVSKPILDAIEKPLA
jgi:Fic family protein